MLAVSQTQTIHGQHKSQQSHKAELSLPTTPLNGLLISSCLEHLIQSLSFPSRVKGGDKCNTPVTSVRINNNVIKVCNKELRAMLNPK